MGSTSVCRTPIVSFGFLPDDADVPTTCPARPPAAATRAPAVLADPHRRVPDHEQRRGGGRLRGAVQPDASPVDLSGWHLSDDVNLPTKYTFPPGTWCRPGRRLVSESELGFSFSSTGSEVIQLTAPDGTTAEDYFDYGPQTADVTQAGIPQGSGNWHFFSPGTLDADNTCASGGGSPPSRAFASAPATPCSGRPGWSPGLRPGARGPGRAAELLGNFAVTSASVPRTTPAMHAPMHRRSPLPAAALLDRARGDVFLRVRHLGLGLGAAGGIPRPGVGGAGGTCP
jgi:hypothetical protein